MNPPPGSNLRKGLFYHGNLPITGMWIYQISTWFLVPGNLVTCAWDGDMTRQWVPTGDGAVIMCQYVGSLGLLGFPRLLRVVQWFQDICLLTSQTCPDNQVTIDGWG